MTNKENLIAKLRDAASNLNEAAADQYNQESERIITEATKIMAGDPETLAKYPNYKDRAIILEAAADAIEEDESIDELIDEACGKSKTEGCCKTEGSGGKCETEGCCGKSKTEGCGGKCETEGCGGKCATEGCGKKSLPKYMR